MPPPLADPTASRLEEEALRLARHGSLKAAAELCRTLTARHPHFASGWRTASSIALQSGDAPGAMTCVERALALASGDSHSLLLKAQCLRALRRPAEALELAKSVRQLLNKDAAALDSLGTFYTQCGEPLLALEAHESALELAPRNAAITFNRATVRRNLGQLAAAEEDYDRVINARPNDFEAYRYRSELRTQTRERNHVNELEKLLEPVMGQPKMGQPIFIVGLPRSGISLVERILGSHSAVFAAGELNEFSQALFDAVIRTANTRTLERQELVARSAKIDFAALGREYLERTLPAAGRKPYFTDRMPLNYLYCGIIRRALPEARIVHLTRHPLAVCHAMYRTLFKDTYPFSYKLEEIGRYYIAYRKLMDHWRTTLPGAIHDCNYERLVNDPLAESRRLLEFCGLEGEDTPQGRHSLYDPSLMQWRNYQTQLDGLRHQLVTAGIDVGSG